MDNLKRGLQSLARLLGAALLVVALIFVVGGTVAVAYERGVEPWALGAWVLVITLGALTALTLVRRLLMAIGLLAVPSPDASGRAPPGTDQSSFASMAWDSSAALPRVHAEIEHGRIWRAKEILQGHVASYPYSPELYASLGDVLAQMGDELEAGKYLFLGARQDPRSQASISLFLSRHTDPQVLFATFPSRAKLRRLEEYPAPVAAELRVRGVKPRVTHRRSKTLPASPTPWAWLGTAWAGFLGVLLLLSLVIGLLWILFALGRVLFA